MNAYHGSRTVWQGIRSWTISWRRGDFVESCCQCWVPRQPRRLQEAIAPGQEIVWHVTSRTTTSGLSANWTQCLRKELVFSSNFQQVSKSVFFSPANSKNCCFNQPPKGFQSGRPQTIYEQLFCETWYSNHDEYTSIHRFFMHDIVEKFKAEVLAAVGGLILSQHTHLSVPFQTLRSCSQCHKPSAINVSQTSHPNRVIVFCVWEFCNRTEFCFAVTLQKRFV